MSSTKSHDTQKKIVEAASRLFAELGYEKTSVREIAKQAEVNIAAINYHFKNKENLYCEVFNRYFEWLEAGINQIENENREIDVENLSWKIFQFFHQNGHALLFIHKIVMVNDVPVPEDFAKDKNDILEFGPPGGEVLQRALVREIGPELPPHGILWAVDAIFTHLVHTAMIMNSSLILKHCEKSPLMDPQLKEFNIRHFSRAIIDYLDKNRDLWRSPPASDSSQMTK